MLVDKHVSASPAAYGPSAATHKGMSTARFSSGSFSMFVQAGGSDFGHWAERAVVRQSTMVEPRVLVEIASVARHCAALPTANTPSPVTQSGTETKRARPLSVASDVQAGGKVTLHVVGGVVVGVQIGRPPAPVVDLKPSAVSRQVMMLIPVVEPVICPVARQVAAVPTANGPKAVTQSATSGMRDRPVSVDSLVHASGRVVMHRLLRDVNKQLTTDFPVVVRPMADVEIQVRVLPTA